ncbi:cytochrome c oxidase subunit 4 isoform 1, mitochondrial [Agrilus planipennis]|uniref:Cytochrome c oxidase subunit 4 n=1 Tax=Agrilus planipennis TaxID=224129 RepID=A0A1W4WC16_AGRPL|nr:cytochrome c oxidase subunit 4 isoform 1, mitochondrial [Agrilus planipennis]XP_018321524.1 cytochrome c oxidase subunit 4 isoform 1, mitochondrial [Agrilus planipennis]
MAGRLLALRALRASRTPFGARGAHQGDPAKALIGNREIVGFGYNGQPNYVDRPDFPIPAIRWKEPTPDIQALREKEKGDWKQLSIEEKKALYRASFCQTFAEFQAPTGEWKMTIGVALLFSSLAIWIYLAMKLWVYSPLPDSFSEESRKAQLRRMLDIQNNPIEGIASKWDYEKDDWKK